MFYKPKFCTECGEKVERIQWQPWTSRRFCEDCAAQYENPIRWKTGISAACILLLGVFAGQIRFTAPKQIAVTNAQTLILNSPKAESSNQTSKNANQSASITTNANVKTSPPETNLSTLPTIVAQSETAYYCGAKTQKGNICTRRVKGAGRCWQHPGKPPMVAQAKLAIRNS